MADGVIDLKKQLRDLKAHEHLAGFTGFRLDLGLGDAPKEGVLKIAEFTRPDGSGYITLTFQTDPDPEPQRRAALAGVFDRFARFAQAFEYIMMASEGLVDGDAWYVVEMDVFYKNLKGRLRELVEKAVLPGLAGVMPVAFEPVNWWD